MMKLVFLVEERSMADLLEHLLPRLFPDIPFQCIPHEGKRDLAKSVPRKLRAWREPGVHFVVMRDQNGADCRQVKAQLVELCQRAGRDDVLVRVVCRELEAWYIGEPEALVRAFPHAGERVRRELRRRRFRNSDEVVNPSAAVAEIIHDFQKRRGARRLGEFLSRDNRSRSFQVFVEGVEGLVGTH